jgi:hypothetical protein
MVLRTNVPILEEIKELGLGVCLKKEVACEIVT